MTHTAAARLLSTEDVVLEILHRVSADAVALFRCAMACKQWRALVAEPSFLRRCWPEKDSRPSTLLGLFVRQPVDVDVDGRLPYRLFFVPPPEGSVLGAQRCLLTSIVDGLTDNDSCSAQPLAGRRGLLLVRLVTGNRHCELVQLAVCDPVAGTCHMLPPLECRVHFVSCTVLTGAECCSSKCHHQRSLNSFKVVLLAFFNDPENTDDQVCNLYTLSSTESRWSAPIEIEQLRKRRFQLPIEGSNVVGGTMVHWLVPCLLNYSEESLEYFTLDVNTETGHTSLTEISIPEKQFGTSVFDSGPTLGVTPDGSLSLFCTHDERYMRKVLMWKRGNHVDSEVWLHMGVINLSKSWQPDRFWGVRMLPVEKSNKLFIIDGTQCMEKVDVETGVVEEEQQLQNASGTWIMPMTIEWPTLFASRLAHIGV